MIDNDLRAHFTDLYPLGLAKGKAPGNAAISDAAERMKTQRAGFLASPKHIAVVAIPAEKVIVIVLLERI